MLTFQEVVYICVFKRVACKHKKNLPLKTEFSDIDYLCLYENSKF